MHSLIQEVSSAVTVNETENHTVMDEFQVLRNIFLWCFSNLTICAVILIVYSFISKLHDFYTMVRKMPPGPWRWFTFRGYEALYNPFVPQHEILNELTKVHGKIISVRKGLDYIVALSDHKLIKQLFCKEQLTGRPEGFFKRFLGNSGIINAQGLLWRFHRRFLQKTLRSLGMKLFSDGKLDCSITFEVHSFLSEIVKPGNDAKINLAAALSTAVGNVISSVIMNKRFDFGDNDFQRYLQLVDEGFMIAGTLISQLSNVPLLPHSKSAKGTMNLLEKNRDEINKFFSSIVEEHERTFDPDNIRDVIDYYILERNESKEKGSSSFHGQDEDKQLHQIMGDLFSAGMETVKTTILWSMVFMIHNPEIQKNVQEELDVVIGSGRLPTAMDMPNLPYTEATILEVLRHSSIVPLGTTHATTEDITVGDYRIPKDSHVIPLLHAVHHDPELWEEPEVFNPNRFLNETGKVVKPEYFMPFGVGRRMCLGDVLARKEIFQFFASILHTCTVGVPEGEDLPSLEGNVGITLSPRPFDISLSTRKPQLIMDTSSKIPNRPCGQ